MSWALGILAVYFWVRWGITSRRLQMSEAQLYDALNIPMRQTNGTKEGQ